MTPEQCREARALLAWTDEDLAKQARCSRATVVNFERTVGRPHPEAAAALRSAFEQAGVEFTNGEGPGVRLRREIP